MPDNLEYLTCGIYLEYDDGDMFGRYRLVTQKDHHNDVEGNWFDTSGVGSIGSIVVNGKKYYYATDYWTGVFPVNKLFTIVEK